MATVESAVAAVVGVVAGFGLFAVLRPLLADVPFTGERFFTERPRAHGARRRCWSPSGVPVGGGDGRPPRPAPRRHSPLGVTRRTTVAAARAWRLLPLLAGIVWLGYLACVQRHRRQPRQRHAGLAYLAGIFAMMVGLVVAGPWLTVVAARASLPAGTDRPAGLLAARRLGDDPHTAFRAVSGVVLAVFVGSCSIGIMTTIVAYNGGSRRRPPS